MDRLEGLDVYRIAEELSDCVWEVVLKWDWFAKRTIGVQLVEAADSIASNIAEGHGRFHYAENRTFCFYARGSLMETRNWLRRASKRGLLSQEDVEMLTPLVRKLAPKLNAYIRSIGSRRTRDKSAPANAQCRMPNAQCPVPEGAEGPDLHQI
jgi:four helix bundle protein